MYKGDLEMMSPIVRCTQGPLPVARKTIKVVFRVTTSGMPEQGDFFNEKLPGVVGVGNDLELDLVNHARRELSTMEIVVCRT